MSLTEQYKRLKRKALYQNGEQGCPTETEQALDAIYTSIITTPVVDVPMAVEKLSFAHHCLTEEYDIKEAANLILQVRQALATQARDREGCWLRVIADTPNFRRTVRGLCGGGARAGSAAAAPRLGGTCGR